MSDDKCISFFLYRVNSVLAIILSDHMFYFNVKLFKFL